MKKSIIRILCSLLLVVSMVTLTACDKTNVKDITGIELVTEPKTQYFYGEELDLSAFELKVIYKKTEVVYKYQDIMDDITVFGYDNKKSGEQELTVTYKVTEKKNVYEGTVKFKVYVDKFKGEVAIPTNFDKVYDGKAIEVKATDYTTNSDATPSIKWYKGETEVEAPVNAGDYRLVISVAETAKFTQASIEKAVKISKQVVAAPDPEL